MRPRSRVAPLLMPVRSLQPCTAAGCPELGNGGRCRAHRRARQAAYNARRGSSSAQGYGAAHRALRAQAIAERGEICQDCGGAPEPGNPIEADHVVALKDGGTMTLDNIRLRHKSEHSRKTALVDRRWGPRA